MKKINEKIEETKKQFVQQQLYIETVEKINFLRERTGLSKAKLYDRSVSRLYNSITKGKKVS